MQLPHLKVAREDVLAGGGGETSRENLAGTDAVDADIVASAQAGDIASKTFEAGLCGNVRCRRKSGKPFQNGLAHAGHGRQGRHIDDRAAPGLDEMRPRRPAGEEAGGQIHSQNAIPGLIGFRGKHFAGAASGIVDEDVQAAIDG